MLWKNWERRRRKSWKSQCKIKCFYNSTETRHLVCRQCHSFCMYGNDMFQMNKEKVGNKSFFASDRKIYLRILDAVKKSLFCQKISIEWHEYWILQIFNSDAHQANKDQMTKQNYHAYAICMARMRNTEIDLMCCGFHTHYTEKPWIQFRLHIQFSKTIIIIIRMLPLLLLHRRHNH